MQAGAYYDVALLEGRSGKAFYTYSGRISEKSARGPFVLVPFRTTLRLGLIIARRHRKPPYPTRRILAEFAELPGLPPKTAKLIAAVFDRFLVEPADFFPLIARTSGRGSAFRPVFF
jgi:primosomal protein N'